MKLMKTRLLHTMQAMALLGLLVAVGCRSLGIPTADTFNQRLAVGLTTVTTIRDTTRILLQDGKLSAADAQNVQNQADNARAGLDIARTLAATDVHASDSKLTAVLVGLNALDAYLKSKGAP